MHVSLECEGLGPRLGTTTIACVSAASPPTDSDDQRAAARRTDGKQRMWLSNLRHPFEISSLVHIREAVLTPISAEH
jgi:hypothetical protein